MDADDNALVVVEVVATWIEVDVPAIEGAAPSPVHLILSTMRARAAVVRVVHAGNDPGVSATRLNTEEVAVRASFHDDRVPGLKLGRHLLPPMVLDKRG